MASHVLAKESCVCAGSNDHVSLTQSAGLLIFFSGQSNRAFKSHYTETNQHLVLWKGQA